MKTKVSIIGVTGYTGLELLRLLAAHDQVEILHLTSKNNAGKKLSDVYPHVVGDYDLVDMDPVQVAEESDVVFLALPHGVAAEFTESMLGKAKIIDLSNDFRHKGDFVYGLAEANAEAISAAEQVANPGCFATACQLALLPLKGNIKSAEVLAITGSSGSGKSASDGTHHPVRSHNVKSYKIGVHQHIPEIVETLGLEMEQLSFVPTSGPFSRGIHLTAFVETDADFDASFYDDAPFVRVKESVQLADVVGSNFCDVSVNKVNGKLVVQAVIDNLVKGAAGSAIQNMNLMLGLDETHGLDKLNPLFP